MLRYILCVMVGGFLGFMMAALCQAASMEDERMKKWQEREEYKLGD